MEQDKESALLERAVAAGVLAAEQLQQARQEQADHPEQSLGEHLVRLGHLTAFQLKCLHAGQLGLLRIGPYRMLDKIGEGGMGAVYRAVHTDLGREVALKILPPRLAKNATMLARFRREARSAAQLEHPNIIAIYDVGEHLGAHYLALEYVDGQDLYEIIRTRGRLSVREALDITTQAARALVHAHQRNIVHRDIKPSNFLIRKDGTVKLADMGLARRFDQVEEESKITRVGTTVGTVDYMAPEQARDSKLADTRSDIYALGCTLYHMLTGDVPFRGGSIPEKLLKHATQHAPDPRTVNPDIPDEVIYILNKMMAKKRAERYQTPAELLADLEQVKFDSEAAPETGVTYTVRGLAALREGEVAAPPAPAAGPAVGDATEKTPAPSTSIFQRHRTGLAVGLGLLPIVLVAVGIFLTRGGKPSPEGPPEEPRTAAPTGAERGPEPPPPDSGPPVEPAATQTATIPPPHAEPPSPAGPDAMGPAVALRTPDRPVQTMPSPVRRFPKEVQDLRRSFLAPDRGEPTPAADAPLVLVRRSDSRTASTLEAAVQQARDGTIIEICDNGPFYTAGFSVADKDLTIRAGKGYRPLVFFDPTQKTRQTRIFEFEKCSLRVQGLDFVAHFREADLDAAQRPLAFFHQAGKDLVLEDCSFTQSGRVVAEMSVVRLAGQWPAAAPDGRQPPYMSRTTLRRCVVRGRRLSAVELLSEAGDVLIDQTLFVSPTASLAGIANEKLTRDDARRRVTVTRSTVITSAAPVFSLTGSSDLRAGHPVQVAAMDSIFFAFGRSSLSAVIRTRLLPPPDSPNRKVEWHGLNNLFGGFAYYYIIRNPGQDSANPCRTLEDWQKLWGERCRFSRQGDPGFAVPPATEDGLIEPLQAALSESSAERDTSLDGRALGAPVADLHGPVPYWPRLALEAAPSHPLALLRERQKKLRDPKRKDSPGPDATEEEVPRLPELPPLGGDPVTDLTVLAASLDHDRLFGGKSVKLAVTENSPPDTVTSAVQNLWDGGVLSLEGSGTVRVRPIGVEKKSLTIQMPPLEAPKESTEGQPAKDKPAGAGAAPAVPLVLEPTADAPAGAFIRVVGGDLVLRQVRIRVPAELAASGKLACVIEVVGGDLILDNCLVTIEGPGATMEAIRFSGGRDAPAREAAIASRAARARPAAPSAAPAADADAGPPTDGPKTAEVVKKVPVRRRPDEAICRVQDCFLRGMATALVWQTASSQVQWINNVVIPRRTFIAVQFAEPPAGAAPADGGRALHAQLQLLNNTVVCSETFIRLGPWPARDWPEEPLMAYATNNAFCDIYTDKVRRSTLLEFEQDSLTYGPFHWRGTHNTFWRLKSFLRAAEAPATAGLSDLRWVLAWGPLHENQAYHDDPSFAGVGRFGTVPFEKAQAKDYALMPTSNAQTRGLNEDPSGADVSRIVPLPPELLKEDDKSKSDRSKGRERRDRRR